MAEQRGTSELPEDQPGATRPVAMTARWIAAARANESARPNRLFDDPYAEVLAGIGQAGGAASGTAAIDNLIVQTSRAFGAPFLAIRTRFFDDLLLGAVRAGVRQVVLLAAGLDARAYRLPWPLGTRLWELDQPALLAAKDAALAAAGAQPSCQRRTLPVDLARPGWEEALPADGFDAAAPSAWLVEGLLMYLEEANVRGLLQAAAALAAPGSRLGADLFNAIVLTSPLLRPLVGLVAAQGAPWRFASDDPSELFAAAGWPARVTEAREAGAAYGRWPFLISPRRLRHPPRYFLIAAQRGPV
jgi:methyltransferase (TIGR00027 family)